MVTLTVSQWVFVAGLVVVAAAVVVIGLVLWPHRRTPTAVLGFAFAVIAVASTINMTITAHDVRVDRERAVAELRRQLACDERILEALRIRDEAFTAALTRGEPLPVFPVVPVC